ncbi:hypothetical protein EKN07_06115 [Actinobaculum sp. 352]|nr:hypothetical protein EKN07_06115 [Actinobaculum sp. 352]
MSDIFTDALCRTDPDGWFPEPGHKDQTATACARCTACPALAACREYAGSLLAKNIRLSGVWAARFYGGRRPRTPRTAEPCLSCGRLTRPHHTSKQDMPDTMGYGAAGPLCITCYRRGLKQSKKGLTSCPSTM